MSKDFKEILNQIATEPTLHTALLYNLSKLTQESLEIFKETWPTINDERRQSVTQELLEISETNFEVDFDPVFLLVMTDTDPLVRVTAVKGLWEYEHPSLIRPLIHLLKTDNAAIVRETAAAALGRFIYLRELEELDWNEATLAEEVLLETIYLASEEINVRRRAVESVSYSGAENITKIIENTYYNDHKMMQVSAVFAMGRNADSHWIPWVIKELENEDVEIRFEAARACGELEVKESVEKLVELIDNDDDTEIQEVAVWSLGRIGGDMARHILEALIEGDDDVLAAAAEESLDELNLFDDPLLIDFDDEDEDGEDGEDGDIIELFSNNLGGFTDGGPKNGDSKTYLH